MSGPSARLLRLLVLLQSRTRWGGHELAERLQISHRTLRYDVSKLRDLGYPVQGVAGTAGGYRLGGGVTLPPLALEDDEAVALAVALRQAAGETGDLGASAATALAKLEQLLPARLHVRVAAVRRFTASVPPGPGGPDVVRAVEFLTAACRDRRRVRFGYPSTGGGVDRRDVEPHRVVQLGGRWYLSAFDPTRDDWRSFRVDRMRLEEPAGARFAVRAAPEPEVLVERMDAHFRRHRAVVVVAAPASDVAARLPASVPVEAVGATRCRVVATGDSAHAVAVNLLLLEEDFVLEEATTQVRRALHVIARRVAESG